MNDVAVRISWSAARRAVVGRRRLLAALAAAAATAAALDVVAPRGPDLVSVLVAARDVAAGTALTAEDVAAAALPRHLAPAGVLRPGAPVIGRAVSGPVRRGEPLTDVRLVGSSLLTRAGAGLVAVPVRLADPDAAALARSGDHVDVIAAPLAADGPAAAVVAARALVLAVPGPRSGGDGSVVVVAVTAATARELAVAATTSRLSLALRPAS